MIRIGKLTDYAVVVLAHLVRAEGNLTARQLAELAEIPQPTVGKVLKALTREGILTSVRGLRGGYGLARSADQILVGEVIEALEGPISLTDCANTDHPHPCGRVERCPVPRPWGEINRVVRKALMEMNIEQMCREEAPSP